MKLFHLGVILLGGAASAVVAGTSDADAPSCHAKPDGAFRPNGPAGLAQDSLLIQSRARTSKVHAASASNESNKEIALGLPPAESEAEPSPLASLAGDWNFVLHVNDSIALLGERDHVERVNGSTPSEATAAVFAEESHAPPPAVLLAGATSGADANETAPAFSALGRFTRARVALKDLSTNASFSVLILVLALSLSVGLGCILISFSGDFDFGDDSSFGDRRAWRQQQDSPVNKGRGPSVPQSPKPTASQPSPAYAASPAPRHVAPAASAADPTGGHEAGLCPELVVPDGSECILAIPTLESLPAHAATLEHCVVDKTGEPLLRIIVERKVGQGSNGAQETLERLTIAAWKDGYALVSGEVRVPQGRGSQGRPYCIISHPQGHAHARVEEVAGEGQARTFVLSSATGAQWQFRIHGFVHDRSLTVTTGAAQLVAAVEPGTSFDFDTHGVEFYKLRVAPRVDAGLLTIAMLAIDRLAKAHEPGQGLGTASV